MQRALEAIFMVKMNVQTLMFWVFVWMPAPRRVRTELRKNIFLLGRWPSK
jgi:hypothetical protein